MNSERESHIEIYGYDDPYLDLSDGSLRSEKVKCYMKCKELGIEKRSDFIEMNKRMVDDINKFITNNY